MAGKERENNQEMKKENIFYIIFLLTVLVIRTEVFVFPTNKLVIGGMRINHFWIGVILFLVAVFLIKSYSAFKMIVLSISLGLLADELTFMIFTGRTINDYWSVYSITGLVIVMTTVFMLRKKLLKIIYN